MNPIVNTRRDSTQSGVDGELSSTPHGTSPISFRRFGRSRASRMWRSLYQEVVCQNAFVTIGSAGAFVESPNGALADLQDATAAPPASRRGSFYECGSHKTKSLRAQNAPQ